MHTLIQPITLLLIIVVGYVFKRFGLFGPRDYRVLQTAEFNLILPGAIIYSFATQPHDIRLLWISLFGFAAAAVPPALIFLATRHRPVSQRAFVMLNGAGFNVGCFCFPVLQAFYGPSALVPAAMFDVGNCIMVAAGTNVLTQTLLHIAPGMTLAEQHAGDAPTLPYQRPVDRDARRLARRTLGRRIVRGFVSSVSFDVYAVMIVLMIVGIRIPTVIADIAQPFANANSLCAMLMVGMLMDMPASRTDVRAVLEVLVWRLPCGIAFAAAAWFLLPFDTAVRQAVALCALAPIAVFSTMFTDKVLGNARLAGFSLALTAAVSLTLMTVAHMVLFG